MLPGGPGGVGTKMAQLALELWKKRMKRRPDEKLRIPSPGGGQLDKNMIPSPFHRDTLSTDTLYWLGKGK